MTTSSVLPRLHRSTFVTVASAAAPLPALQLGERAGAVELRAGHYQIAIEPRAARARFLLSARGGAIRFPLSPGHDYRLTGGAAR